YLTRDLDDAWMKQYTKEANLYPILGAFRDARGPRYEVRFTNRGDKPGDFGVHYIYNRLPWGMNEGLVAKGVAAGASSEWAVLKELAASKAPGKKPTKPLCYGGWLPLGREDDYGRKYAQLYAALGFRSLHPANSGTAQVKNLEAVGIPVTKSWAVGAYRNPPT